MKWNKFFNVLVFLIIISIFSVVMILPRFTKFHLPFSISKTTTAINLQHKKIKVKALQLKQYAIEHGYDTTYAFLIDIESNEKILIESLSVHIQPTILMYCFHTPILG